MGGSDGEVILGVEISGVVVLVNLAYLLEEVGEGPDASIVHQQAGSGLKLAVGLESGESEGVVHQVEPHGGGYVVILEATGHSLREHTVCGVKKRTQLGAVQVPWGVTSSGVNETYGLKKGVGYLLPQVLGHGIVVKGCEGEVFDVAVEELQGEVQALLIGRAQAKKSLFLADSSLVLDAVTSMPNFSRNHSVSMSK